MGDGEGTRKGVGTEDCRGGGGGRVGHTSLSTLEFFSMFASMRRGVAMSACFPAAIVLYVDGRIASSRAAGT